MMIDWLLLIKMNVVLFVSGGYYHQTSTSNNYIFIIHSVVVKPSSRIYWKCERTRNTRSTISTRTWHTSKTMNIGVATFDHRWCFNSHLSNRRIHSLFDSNEISRFHCFRSNHGINIKLFILWPNVGPWSDLCRTSVGDFSNVGPRSRATWNAHTRWANVSLFCATKKK